MATRPALLLVAFAALVTAALPVTRSFLHRDISALIGFGCVPGVVCFALENRELLPGRPYVFASGGYDGQFFYYIAREIYGPASAVVDDRALRYARIGYPLLAGWPGLFGAPAAMFGMILIPWFVHLWVTFLILRRLGARAACLWAVNPFSVLSSLLSVADGFALSLAAAAFLFLRDGTEDRILRKGRAFAAAFVFFTAALLSKETMLAVILGTAFASMCILVVYGRAMRGDALRAGAPGIRYAAGAILPLLGVIPALIWWQRVDFTLMHAGRHGGMPLGGMLDFLREDPGSLGRAFLVIVFAVCVFSGAWMVFTSFLALRVRPPISALPGIQADLAAGTILLVTAGLTVFATDEYWHNFANIARLFTPSVVGLVWASNRNRVVFWMTGFLFGGLLFVLVRAEFSAKILPSVPF